MKSAFLLIFLIIITFQNPEYERRAQILLKDLTESAQINSESIEAIFNNGAKVKHLNTDTLDFDVIHYRFYLKIKRNECSVSLLTYLGKPLKVSCFEDLTLFDEPIINIETVLDSISFARLNERYNMKYHTNVSLEDIPLSSIQQDYIGFSCLASGQMPELGRKMLQLVDKEEKEELLKWAYSLYPVKKIYGFIGLKLLNYDSEIIEEIKYDIASCNVNITPCSGCNIFPTLPLSEYLNSNHFKHILKSYREN